MLGVALCLPLRRELESEARLGWEFYLCHLCVTLGKLLDFFIPWMSHMLNKDTLYPLHFVFMGMKCD